MGCSPLPFVVAREHLRMVLVGDDSKANAKKQNDNYASNNARETARRKRGHVAIGI